MLDNKAIRALKPAIQPAFISIYKHFISFYKHFGANLSFSRARNGLCRKESHLTKLRELFSKLGDEHLAYVVHDPVEKPKRKDMKSMEKPAFRAIFQHKRAIFKLETSTFGSENRSKRNTGAITFGVFEEKIRAPAVRDYFETLGLDAPLSV